VTSKLTGTKISKEKQHLSTSNKTIITWKFPNFSYYVLSLSVAFLKKIQSYNFSATKQTRNGFQVEHKNQQWQPRASWFHSEQNSRKREHKTQ
jgi:hypothetical protein